MAALAYLEPTTAEEFESRIYVPAGWPEQVFPPGAPQWEKTATAFLLDQCPADYRRYTVLRKHPVVLARFAAEHVEAQLRATTDGLAGARASLREMVPNTVLDEAVEAWQAEHAHLVRVRRAVALVEEALRGRIFIRKL